MSVFLFSSLLCTSLFRISMGIQCKLLIGNWIQTIEWKEEKWAGTEMGRKFYGNGG